MESADKRDFTRSLRVLIEHSPHPGRLVVSVVAASGRGDARNDHLLVRHSVAGDLMAVTMEGVLREARLALLQTADAIGKLPAEGGPESP
jgi:hypothetical protein